jgi:predicted membrane protein
MHMILPVLLWSLGGLIGYAAAERRGFSKVVGVIAGVLLGPVFAWTLFWVSGIARRNDFRGGVGPAAPPRPRRNALTMTLVAINVVLGLIIVALLIVRAG